MSRMLLKKSSNSKVSFTHYLNKYLETDPAIFFIRQGFIKTLSDSKHLIGFKKLKVLKSYNKINKLSSLDCFVFKVDHSILIYLLGFHLRKREKTFKFNWLKVLYQRLLIRWFFLKYSCLIKTKGIISWPVVSYLLGAKQYKDLDFYVRRSKSVILKKDKIKTLFYLLEKKKVSFFRLSYSLYKWQKLGNESFIFLNYLFTKQLKKDKNVLNYGGVENTGVSLSNWEERKGLVSGNLILSPKNRLS